MRIACALSVVVLLVVTAAVLLLERGRPASALAGRVTYVIDGDTVVVRLASDEVHVRLIGVNTPEIAHYGKPGECFGQRAARLTRRLALGRQVVLRPGRERHDRYGRLLAYVRVLGGPADLERTLLTRGAARTLAIAPNIDRAPAYADLERAARRAGRGLWGACGSQ